MVQRLQPPLLLVPLKHGKVGDPRGGVLLHRGFLEGVDEVQADPVQRLVDHGRCAGSHQEQVTLSLNQSGVCNAQR